MTKRLPLCASSFRGKPASSRLQTRWNLYTTVSSTSLRRLLKHSKMKSNWSEGYLFVETVVRTVKGEDEIWLVESGVLIAFTDGSESNSDSGSMGITLRSVRRPRQLADRIGGGVWVPRP